MGCFHKIKFQTQEHVVRLKVLTAPWGQLCPRMPPLCAGAPGIVVESVRASAAAGLGFKPWHCQPLAQAS